MIIASQFCQLSTLWLIFQPSSASQVATVLHSSIVAIPYIAPPQADLSKWWSRKFSDGLALVRVTLVTPDAVQMQVSGGVQDAVQVTYSML